MSFPAAHPQHAPRKRGDTGMVNVQANGREPAEAKVLVVDDEPPIAELVTTALRFEGFDVTSAPDGQAALRAVMSFRPDLVILDVMLPDLDGFEVQDLLRRDRLDVPVLFLTARDAIAAKVRGLTLGADDYMTK